MSLFNTIFPTSLFGQRTAERAPDVRAEAFRVVQDELEIAVVDADGERLRERDVRKALKIIARLS